MNSALFVDEGELGLSLDLTNVQEEMIPRPFFMMCVLILCTGKMFVGDKITLLMWRFNCKKINNNNLLLKNKKTKKNTCYIIH
mgnify:CR=1 FL=1